MDDPGIVRNRLKVNAVRKNARAFLEMQAEHGSFDAYLWDWVDGTPLRNARRARARAFPATTPLAESDQQDLKKRGFTFVGPTIVYAYLQSTGVVNDHVVELLPLRRGPTPARRRAAGPLPLGCSRWLFSISTTTARPTARRRSRSTASRPTASAIAGSRRRPSPSAAGSRSTCAATGARPGTGPGPSSGTSPTCSRRSTPRASSASRSSAIPTAA